MNLSSRAIALGTCLYLLAAAPVVAKDTHAPAGARDRWLPCESWVMFHWVPFDQQRLWAITGIKQLEFRHYIADDDNHTLALLIREHGKDPAEVARQLMEPRRDAVSDAQFAELTRRTDELMTQGHLAQHVFFHYFHDPLLALHSNWIFNISPGDYHRARLQGFSPAEIAIRGGVPVKRAVRRAMVVMRRNQNEAVARGQTSRRQADSFIAQQRVFLDFWLTQKLYARRKGSFPAGHSPARGGRPRQACTYLAGSAHPAGAHDDHTGGSPLESELASLRDKHERKDSLFCNLIRANARPEVDPAEVAGLRDYIHRRGM